MRDNTAQFAHFILQVTPGVGASLVASLVAQHIQLSGRVITAIDANPANSTLTGLNALTVQAWDLRGQEATEPQAYQNLIDHICLTDTDFVVDAGAPNFPTMNWYLRRQDVRDRLVSAARQPVVHTMIQGGPGLQDSLQHFSQIARRLDASIPIIVWLNNYWGTTETDGNSFEESDEYLRHKSKIRGIVHLRRPANSMFGVNLAGMFARRLTFPEIRMAYGFTLTTRQRLAMMSREVFQQLGRELINGIHILA